ncbi:MAG: hypothetical protein V4594_20190 [Bacteroidota bacterium]
MHPIHNDYLNEKDDPEFNDSLLDSMKRAGYVFPETEEELDYVIDKFNNSKVIIPDDLNDPTSILKQGLLTVKTDFNSSTDQDVDINLAQAAREGGIIEEDVKSQMNKDRKTAEDERRNKETK